MPGRTVFDRRSFLKRFAAATAAAVTATAVGVNLESEDLDRLLWTPGAKKIIDLGARPLIAPGAAEIKTLSTEELFEQAREKILAHATDAQRYAMTHNNFPPIMGRLVRNQKLVLATANGYGEVNLINGKPASEEDAKRLRELDKEWAPRWPRDSGRISHRHNGSYGGRYAGYVTSEGTFYALDNQMRPAAKRNDAIIKSTIDALDGEGE